LARSITNSPFKFPSICFQGTKYEINREDVAYIVTPHPQNFPLFLLQVFLHWQVCSKSLEKVLHTYLERLELLPKSMELTTHESSRSSW